LKVSVHPHDVSNDVLKILRKIIRAVDLQSKQLVKEYGLTGPQIIILKEIYAKEGITVSEIAANINLSQSTVTNILDRLEKRGLITRRRSDTDKRRVIVKIEDAGMEMIKNDPSLLQEHFIQRFRKLQDWEQSAILSSLQRVASMMDATEIEDPVSPW
jgi:DNA-binding MarR family transcriptional regulator